MNAEEVAQKVESLGYEYAERMMDVDDKDLADSFSQFFGVQLDANVYGKISRDALIDWITADDDAQAEQTWEWSSDAEACGRDAWDFVDDWKRGVERFVDENVKQNNGKG